MREAMVICPQADNAGWPLDAVKAEAVRRMIGTFGGVTVRAAEGHWMDDGGRLYVEPVWELVAACEPGDDASAALRSIAEDIGYSGRQECVYLRHPDGRVEFVPTRDLWAGAAAAA